MKPTWERKIRWRNARNVRGADLSGKCTSAALVRSTAVATCKQKSAQGVMGREKPSVLFAIPFAATSLQDFNRAPRPPEMEESRCA
jgi:hypothetical protein